MEKNIQLSVDKELEREPLPPPDQQMEREQPLIQSKIEPPDEDFPQEKPSSFIPTAPQTFENDLSCEKSPPPTKISESDPQTLFKTAKLTTEWSQKETVELSGSSADLTQWLKYIMKPE
ncbi:hypothetical protein niasHT_009838 [Heterodera trifolii]|uniref:Uncharacterized protein n=1 Tax=Heterodera trifolii TaxID=157864 RepID=A0ABD2LT32_9BILA